MAAGDDAIEALRDALRDAPDNVRLRQHLAEMLLRYGHTQQAVEEYRETLNRCPDDPGLKLGLANAFYRDGKYSPALVIVEELLKSPSTAGEVYVLHARLLLRAGDIDRAVRQYRRGIEQDPEAADDSLEETLGLNGEPDSEVIDGRVRVPGEQSSSGPDIELERPRINFDDVGGMEAVKEEIRLKIIHPLSHRELYEAYGKQIGGGILLYGPPGCGKTHLARATAGEIKAGFLTIGINDVLDMWLGNSERNLHEVFQHARQHKPCVLFFDEVDALGASRADLRQSAGRHLVNQFLAELDGAQYSNDGVLILAATNAPWHLDSAFRRPGRFDRIIFVPPPDSVARSAILRILVRGKPAEEIDFDKLAAKTNGFSGADLKALVDQAIERKLQEAMRAGVPKPMTTKDLLAAVAAVRPSTKEWFSTARNHAIYANQGGIYDDVLKYLKLL
ncbi:MAG TPA: AAA family ATPase [Phycisphaerae bacterium]|nr:AAA family ATPase [Phycisphaerae bacterium]HRR85670.1 AAA family ATPase [Phycisphaerae bacterium]